ncbi:unnamed protein product [Adineta steineri]|uniref:Uncharacterized protein n=2 Tax=Adineta steineri TaxID=433720 RepID=A0A814PFG0_9BILA|nr:unnamed protein product [Adineta steineri]
MIFQQEFYTLWAGLELFMSMTHLFVFLGIRNSKLGFIRRQQNYFLLDGFTHLINVLIHSPKTVGWPLYIMWIYAFFVHLYYYHNLVSNPPPKRGEEGKVEDNSHKISRIFHWSCIEFQANRFSIMQSGKEIAETTLDVVAHTSGFVLAFRLIESYWYKAAAIILFIGLFYRQMLNLKYFFTEPKMMPPQLQRFFASFSTPSVAN